MRATRVARRAASRTTADAIVGLSSRPLVGAGPRAGAFDALTGSDGPVALRDGGVYLITGGLGGVGLTLAGIWR